MSKSVENKDNRCFEGNNIKKEKSLVILARNKSKGCPISGVMVGCVINIKDIGESPVKQDMERWVREQILIKQSFGEY